jgi:hypothetical protein
MILQVDHDTPPAGRTSPTLSQTCRELVHHPIERIVRRWNWKSALLSALVRGVLFFVATLEAGLSAALGAMRLEAAFYILTAGFYGALLEAFRRVEPPWKATLAVMGMLPAINHSLEFLWHRVGGTERLGRGMAASISFSVLSASFNLFAMRRGALLVGADRQSLGRDLQQLPWLACQFLWVVPALLKRYWRERSTW